MVLVVNMVWLILFLSLLLLKIPEHWGYLRLLTRRWWHRPTQLCRLLIHWCIPGLLLTFSWSWSRCHYPCEDSCWIVHPFRVLVLFHFFFFIFHLFLFYCCLIGLILFCTFLLLNLYLHFIIGCFVLIWCLIVRPESVCFCKLYWLFRGV